MSSFSHSFYRRLQVQESDQDPDQAKAPDQSLDLDQDKALDTDLGLELDQDQDLNTDIDTDLDIGSAVFRIRFIDDS